MEVRCLKRLCMDFLFRKNFLGVELSHEPGDELTFIAVNEQIGCQVYEDCAYHGRLI